MSLRTSRRSQAAASGAVDEVPSVPISEIRARKWSKQIKTVGHITIVKWVPEQEHPTEALQRGGFKKTKGRKRPVAEMSRMTRSVRQHLDAPLELLVEMPAIRQSTRATAGLGIVPTGQPAPAATATAAAPVTTVPTSDSAAPSVPAAPVSVAAPAAVSDVTSSASLLGMSSDSMMFSDGVASEEQLERALDDLPFLDSDNLAMDNLAMDPVLALGREESSEPRQQPPSASTTQAENMPTPAVSAPQETAPPRVLVAQPSPNPSVSAASAEEDGVSSSSDSSDDDDDDDDDGNETASVDSAATPQQSPSPVMSRSPSP